MTDLVRDAIAEMTAELTSSGITGSVVGFGVDLICLDDFTPSMAETDPNSLESLVQDNYHRLITEPGTVPDDLDYGIDVMGYLSLGMTQDDKLQISGDVETQLKRDDRNAEVSATVAVTDTLPTTLALTVGITPADPALDPFTLLIAIDQTGTSLKVIF